MSLGGSKGKGETVKTETNSAPWAQVQPYLQNLFSSAQGLYNRGPMQYFPGNTVADQSPYTQQSIEKMAGTSTDPNSLTNQGAAQFGNTIRGDYLNPESNPYLEATVNKALGQARGQVNATFGRGGGNNFGSSAHEETLGRTMADTALPYYMQNYDTERGRQMQASQLAPGVDMSKTAGLGAAGAATDAYQQKQIDANKARFDFNQMSPWDALQRYQGGITGQYGGTQTATQPYYPSNPFANILGGAAGAMGIFGMGKDFGWWGGAGSGAGSAAAAAPTNWFAG